MANIESTLGKCQVYGRRTDQAPQGIAELGPEVWRIDKPEAQRGLQILGTPIGSREFVSAKLEERMQGERRLLNWLPQLPDLQCAWSLLLYCASPRANHLLRTVPPAEVQEYAAAHDMSMGCTLHALLGNPELDADTQGFAQQLATLPGRHGGLGLQNAVRTAPAAYWAAWADGLHLMQQRRRRAAGFFTSLLA